jgi:hypothetical protein
MSKPKTADPAKMVLVNWLDAYTHDSGWKSGKTLRKAAPVMVHTMGFVVKDDPDFITVAASHVPCDDHWDGDTVIPRGMIKSLVELGPK